MQVTILTILILIATTAGQTLRVGNTDEADPLPGSSYCTPGPNLPAPPASDVIRIMPGWPQRTTSHPNFGPTRGVALADLDGDGQLEVIRGSTQNQLFVWRANGTAFTGWPRTLNASCQEAAAVEDVDRDGEYEICVATRGMTEGGKVYLFRADGSLETGWPFTGPWNGNFGGAPCLADVNHDDTMEIIVGERAYPIGYLHVLNIHGQEISPAWPCSLDHVPTGTAAVGDINLDGDKEIVYLSYNSLYVFRPDGTLLPGWPQTNPGGGYFSYQSPALADIDGDDTLEIVSAEHRDGAGVYVWRHDGTLLSGWPYSFPRWTYCPPTVADLFRDGELKVFCGLSGVMGGGAYVFYGFDAAGSELNGFPYYQDQGDAAEGNPTVADVDGDGDMEVIFTSNLLAADTGYLYACHANGDLVAGWPLRPQGWTYLNGATVADVDGDDSLDIVTTSYDNASGMYVTVWETDVPFARAGWEWPTYHFNMARTGLYERYVSGVAEPDRPAGLHGETLLPTLAAAGAHLTWNHAGPVELLDRTGRRTATLTCVNRTLTLPGSIASGVYFLIQRGKDSRAIRSITIVR